MDRKIIEEFSKKSSLSAKFLECFSSKFVSEASKLALILAQLGIKFDPSTPFDQNVSPKILKQYENLLCCLGDTTPRKKLNDLQQDKQDIDKLIKNLEELRLKKKDLDLNEEQFKHKRDHVEKLNRDMKELDRPEKNMSSHLIIELDGLEKNSFLNEKSKNEQLKTELETLEDELQGLVEIDLSTETNLDEQIRYLERKYRSYYHQNQGSSFFNSSR